MPHSTKEKYSRYRKNQKAASIKAGKCSTCHKRKPRKGRKTCRRCGGASKRSRDKNYAKGLCKCGRMRVPKGKCCEKCRARSREYSRRIRHECIMAYGGYRCACCGETTPEFLQLDHKNNDGARHRREIGEGNRIYVWAIRYKFPPGLQVLCANCNYARAHYGRCPHQPDKDVNHVPRQNQQQPEHCRLPHGQGYLGDTSRNPTQRLGTNYAATPVKVSDFVPLSAYELEHLFDI